MGPGYGYGHAVSYTHRSPQGLHGYYGGYGYEDMAMARDLLSQVMVMLSATTTEAPRVSMDTMEVMDMVVIMARDLLSQDIMAVPALLSTRAVLTTMDLMAMVSTTMARGLLMLDTMAMDMPMVAAATSMLTDHTLPMVSVLLTLTK